MKAMNTAGWDSPEASLPGSPAADAFRIFIACEDRVTGQRALQLYERLVCRHSGEFRFFQSLVKFDTLEAQSIREAAAAEAARADMVILSVRGDRPLTEPVTSWLDSLAADDRERARASALIVLLGCPKADELGARWSEYLGSVAARSGMDLFIHAAETGSAPPGGPAAVEAPRLVSQGGGGAAAFQSAPRRWGINE